MEVMMADLWKFDMLENQWYYVAGSRLANTHGAYPSEIGTGTPSIGPGARVSASMAFNQLTNELYIFGGFGYGYVRGEVGYLNDLWSFNTVDNTFYWYGGSSGINAKGSLKVPKMPSARSSGLLFSGNDGLESELTLIGGIEEESKDKPAGIADVWMVNVKVPAGFSRPAPETTNPPTTTTRASVKEETSAPQGDGNGDGDDTDSGDHDDERDDGDDDDHDDHDDEGRVHHRHAKTKAKTKSTFHKTDTTRSINRKATAGPSPPKHSLFDGGPQKVAGVVMGSFVAVVLLVGGIVFLGFSFVSSAAPSGSRVVLEPYTSV